MRDYGTVQYYEPIESDGLTYSIDKMKIRARLPYNRFEVFKEEHLENSFRKNVKSKVKYSKKDFKYFYAVQYDDLSNVTFQLYHNNSGSGEEETIYMEFNPNKMANCETFREELLSILRDLDEPELYRFDLAIDMARNRNEIAFIKDQRLYEAINKSPLNRTEYLGDRGDVGRVKLYNKQIESSLEKPLTRLEITGGIKKDYTKKTEQFVLKIPKVVDLSRLEKSESLIINLVLFNTDFTQALAMVSQYYRGKIKALINKAYIEFDESAINQIIAEARAIIERGLIT